MTRPGIKPWAPGLLANTLPTRSMIHFETDHNFNLKKDRMLLYKQNKRYQTLIEYVVISLCETIK